ncbi:hypothetical protein HK096_003268 [Nowakowskiella sp. JEL0078]|nr:hypothetical protein HK096_003268 [Nowakowskiella sp. JEL0078]
MDDTQNLELGTPQEVHPFFPSAATKKYLPVLVVSDSTGDVLTIASMTQSWLQLSDQEPQGSESDITDHVDGSVLSNLENIERNSSNTISQLSRFSKNSLISPSFFTTGEFARVLTDPQFLKTFPTNFSISPSLTPSEKLLFPIEVVEEVLTHFFQTLNSWPTNLLHERSFMASWIKLPRELVYALCARGAVYITGYRYPFIL